MTRPDTSIEVFQSSVGSAVEICFTETGHGSLGTTIYLRETTARDLIDKIYDALIDNAIDKEMANFKTELK